MLMPENSQPDLRNRLTRRFFSASATTVAKRLLGKSLVRLTDSGQWIGGKIVETEAYLSKDDPASHSHRGQTRRNLSMFSDPGTLYVYSIHAKYCMNVTTERCGIGSAVLIRAIEPLWGIDHMQKNRQQIELGRLTRGPAMLCQAIGVAIQHDRTDLITSAWLAILRGKPIKEAEIMATQRIGISRAVDLNLRFVLRGNRFASR